MDIKLGKKIVGNNHPVYFIADIAANHDGDLNRAKMLIHIAKECGADAAKFQNFKAPKIVSDYGFTHMGGQQSHQSSWKKSVFQVYTDVSLPDTWTPELKETCDKEGIDYFSASYDLDSIDYQNQYMEMFKIGSGDIDWIESLKKVAGKMKPVLLATGASDLSDVQRAVRTITEINPQLVLMQCNTNYTANPDNYNHIHLRVLTSYHALWPDLILGLSDHTAGHATVLGAVALGAKVIEKHFTDDNNRVGPDHKFAMNPQTWVDMVENTRQLEKALGSSDKFVAENEKDTVVIQRRCLRAARDLKKGEVLTREMIDVLRPAVKGSILPPEIDNVIGTRVLEDIPFGKELRWVDLGK